jgi:DNA-binding NtrC family response regulator
LGSREFRAVGALQGRKVDLRIIALVQALAATRGERGKAARRLGIGRTTLDRKMKQYGIE